MAIVTPNQTRDSYRAATTQLVASGHSTSAVFTSGDSSGSHRRPAIRRRVAHSGVATPPDIETEAPQADTIQNGRERWPDGGGGRDRGVSDTQPLLETGILEGSAREGMVQHRTDPRDIHGGDRPDEPRRATARGPCTGGRPPSLRCGSSRTVSPGGQGDAEVHQDGLSSAR